MAFFLNKSLVYIDSIQFMNSNLDKLVKNLSDEYFKYLVEDFFSKNLKPLKQKGHCPYEYMNSFKKNCVLENIFIAIQNMGKLVMMVKYQTAT